MEVRGELTTIRPATDEDAPMLVAWHADPEVARFWDDETFTLEQVLERLHREPVDAWIVEADGEPVGYLQSWWEDTGVGSTEPAKSGGAGSAGAGAGNEPRRGGIDMFLVPAARDRGLGPDAGRALAEHLLAEGWESVTVDPYAWNERAVAAWRKAGFREVSRHDADGEHPAPWLLMRYEPLR